VAGQSITFDFLSRGAASLSRDFRSIGDDSALSSRGVKVLQDTIERLGSKADRTAAESKLLASALRQTGDAADRAAAKAVLADAAIRRLGDAEQEASKKSDGLNKALGGLKLNPGLLGPAVALAPALGTLTGVAAGAGVALGGAFVAGGLALAAFGSVAKPILTDAKTAATAVGKAQDAYNIAIANGVPPAKAYKAEQLAIAKAYGDMSPAQIALSKQLGAMATAWDKVKAAQTPVVAGALQPWLKSVTDLTGMLGPIIAKVAPVIGKLGGQFDALIGSPAFKAFRDFIANTGSKAVGAIGGTLIDFVNAFVILLPKFNPLIEKGVGWIAALGPAVLKWANSKKTADDITKFMDWFRTNGPVVGGLLTNIGGALKALAPGLTTGGTFELKIISDFFGLVAKLPASFAKPITEVAGTLLILSKLGVLKVGVQIVGAAAKWLTGGVVNLGGGAAAGAEIRAAMVSGGTAAAAEIRAAMAGGGAAAGAEGTAGGAAGGTAKGAAGGGIAAAGAAAGVVVAGAFAGALIKAVGDTLSPSGTFAGKLNGMFQRLQGPISTSVLHAFTFGGLEAWVTAKIGQPVGAALLATGKFIQNTWATIWANTIGGASSDGKRLVATVTGTWTSIANGAKLWWGTITASIAAAWNTIWAGTRTAVAGGLAFIAGSWQKLQAGVVSAYNTVRTSIAAAWNTIWADTRNVVNAGLAFIAGAWRTLQAGVTSAYNTVRTNIASAWSTIWTNTRNAVTTGIAAVVGFFQGLAAKVTAAVAGAGTWLLQAGKNVIQGFWNGLTSIWTQVTTWIGTIASWIKAHKGPVSLDQQLLYPAGQALMGGFFNGLKAGFGPVGSFVGGIASWILGKIKGAGGKLLGGKIVLDTSQFSAAALASGVGVSNASAVAAISSAAAKHGWGPAQVKAWLRLESYEDASLSLTARNPSSGAYGLAQFIGGPSEYYTYGGNPNTYAGQATAQANYIAQRYGTPAAALAFETSHTPYWYASGTSSAMPGWAWVGERGPELVKFRGGEQVAPVRAGSGGSGDGWAALVAELRALRGQMAELNRTTAAIPAATGRHVGGAIGGAASSASFRSRYPRGGA
jgi:phage-related protein